MVALSNIGSYRIIRLIGEGAFGAVYEAYQPFLDRGVAVKTLHSELMSNPDMERQFMHEARTIARLRHPNIVTVYEFGTVPTDAQVLTYMVMEYLSGETLQTRLKAGVLTSEEVVNIVEQLAQALDYAHSHHIIHRDLKPANIIFTDANQPVIVDFGLAQLMEMSGMNIEAQNAAQSTLSGTPAYMAPEQVSGGAISPATDQFSLALITYEMLTRRLPYEANNIARLLVMRWKEPPTPIRAIAPQFSEETERVLNRALSRIPTERFTTTTDFARELGNALTPERRKPLTVTIYDPIQAAQLRATRQTLIGFMWGIVAIAIIIALLSGAVFLRGYSDGSPEFTWDGLIVAGVSSPYGNDMVQGMWPGSPAETAGYHIGDIIQNDVSQDYKNKDADFIVNNVPRSALPAYWQPQVGDVISRNIWRNGEKITLTYTLQLSNHLLILLIVHLIPSILAMGAGIWLLRRWAYEPALPAALLLMIGTSFTLLSSVTSYVIRYIDTVADFMLFGALLHFILTFPAPIRFFERHPRWSWALYAPMLLALVNFVLGKNLIRIGSVSIILPILLIYPIVILAAIVLKWLLRDLKYYPSLRWLIVGFAIAVICVVIPVAAFTMPADLTKAIFGNGMNSLIFGYVLPIVATCIPILMGLIGYHRVQQQIGPSVILSEPQSVEALKTLDAHR